MTHHATDVLLDVWRREQQLTQLPAVVLHVLDANGIELQCNWAVQLADDSSIVRGTFGKAGAAGFVMPANKAKKGV